MTAARPPKKKNVLPCGRVLPPSKKSTPSSNELLEQLTAQLNAFCASKKLNRSDAREKILATIVAEGRHFTALDLLERLQRQFPEIGKATVYRNLPVLVESGILQEGPHDRNGQVTYELAEADHHDHIVCLDCRRIFEFHDDKIEDRQNAVTSRMHFTPRQHRHVIFASCEYLRNHQK